MPPLVAQGGSSGDRSAGSIRPSVLVFPSSGSGANLVPELDLSPHHVAHEYPLDRAYASGKVRTSPTNDSGVSAIATKPVAVSQVPLPICSRPEPNSPFAIAISPYITPPNPRG